MTAANLSSDCAILAAWQPTIYAYGCCTFSSSCNSAGNVRVVDLWRNQLTGPIPTELGQLTSLRALVLSSNNLTGTIPTELGQLTSLTLLDLQFSQLTGTIPTELGQLTSLRALVLSSNNLTGTIPTELGQLTSLTLLDLQFSQLTGTIPTELGQLTSLRALFLAGNQLTGTIPTELGRLTSLATLDLHNNTLTGTVVRPTSLTELTNPINQQQAISPIIGGVAGAAVLLCLATVLGNCFCRKRVMTFKTDDGEATFGSYVDNVKEEKAGLLDNLENLLHD
ncbi:hypothetical protein BJ741DRAFT_173817 [Chytriomyces cf. hyalinus JEL632]|nr:hypothetical protein BJ741DRAFT_173817 [Chytriomyces cf. hyalinus JEL632]